MARQHAVVKDSLSDRIFMVINYLALTALLVIVLYPLIYIVSASFSDARAVTSGRVWLFPISPTLAGYTAIFKNKFLVSGFANSVFYTVAGTLIDVVLTFAGGLPALSARSAWPPYDHLSLFLYNAL